MELEEITWLSHVLRLGHGRVDCKTRSGSSGVANLDVVRCDLKEYAVPQGVRESADGSFPAGVETSELIAVGKLDSSDCRSPGEWEDRFADFRMLGLEIHENSDVHMQVAWGKAE